MKRRLVLAGVLAAAFLSASAAGMNIGPTARADEDIVPGEDISPYADVEINETNFPDSNFRYYVRLEIDKDKDMILSEEEREAVEEIACEGRGIEDLTGIEFFSNLTSLYCSANKLTFLDVSKNTQLEELYCNENKLTSLDVSENTHLDSLECCDNKLTSLDVSNNYNLNSLQCGNNGITELNLKYNPNLLSLDCPHNGLTSLDLQYNTKMSGLDCSYNDLENLDLSKNTKLGILLCNASGLTTLDISENTGIYSLECASNELTELDLSHNDKITRLYCEKNSLKSLDVSNLPGLEHIECYQNEIESLDVSANTKLEYLDCSDNRLTSLLLPDSNVLTDCYCKHNKLDQVDISNCPKLVLKCDEARLVEDGKVYELMHDIGSEYNGDVNYEKYADFDSWIELTPYLFDRIPRPGDPTPTPRPATPTPTPTDTPTPTPTPTDTPIPTDTPTPTPKKDKPIPTPKKNTPTPKPVPSTGKIGEFIERLYTIALDRPSEEDGKEYWVNEITSGNKTGADCGRFFLLGEEFNNRGLNVEDFVETLYKTFFGRDSEPEGKAYWVGELKKGTKTRENVINGFIDSSEWCNICADYGVKSGAPSAKAEHASQNAIGFATRLYTCCLGREPEEGGLNYWSLALTNLEQTGCSAVREFFKSEEFTNFKLETDEYIRRLYTTFMDREPEASEVAYWAGEIAAGTQTRDSVLAFFGQSEEFTNVCKSYGIDRGTI